LLKAPTVGEEPAVRPQPLRTIAPASREGRAHAPAPVYELTVVAPTFNESANVETLVARLHAALAGVAWQVVFVDDDSPDGTAEVVKAMAVVDPRVQCLRRVGRRGLAGAVVEGVLASAAPYVAVIDADLQHDETLLPKMLQTLKAGDVELVIASRYVESSSAEVEGLGRLRGFGSRLANWLGRMVLRQDVSDPVSGFFMTRRAVIERVAPRLTTEGFKILFDIIATQAQPLDIVELPYVFREREAGGSKLDSRIVIDYFGLLVSKLSGGVVPTRALLFGLVGATGLVIHLSMMKVLLASGLEFDLGQLIAAVTAMTSNYLINNEITYRDRRRRGWGLLLGYAKFCGLCSIGLFANVAVASLVHGRLPAYPLVDSAAGAAFGALWNYVTTSVAVW
jgi:dolichol-phosphate mannosyltransferase